MQAIHGTTMMSRFFYAVKGSAGIKGLSSMVLLSAVLWGCAAPVAQRPAALPATPLAMASGHPMAEPEGPSDGSLWDERGALADMFSNPKARRVGDILTIRIVETSTAKNKATTTTGRDSGMSAGLSGFFNLEKRFPADQPFFNPFSSVGGTINSTFKGSGETERSGALNAFMTARVADVLPNGNLVIVGNREVRVNADNQIITLTGIVRPRDISADNVIQSTYIADARISYSGRGVLNERQKPGWLTRIMDVVWPF